MTRLLLPAVLIVALLLWGLRVGWKADRRRLADVEENDLDQLEAAENEVRDLGASQSPQDGFEGDDWGPGAGGRR